MELAEALKIVKAAGYRVSKPKPKSKPEKGPVCVATFADGEVIRMSVALMDQERCAIVARRAWQCRKRRPLASCVTALCAEYVRATENIETVRLANYGQDYRERERAMREASSIQTRLAKELKTARKEMLERGWLTFWPEPPAVAAMHFERDGVRIDG